MHFQLSLHLICVQGSKKKVLMVKLFDGFSNRIVNIRSVNRKFGYMSHPYCWCLLLLLSICCYLLWKGLTCGSIFHMLWWFNQKSVIDATWEPSLVDEVKDHLRSSCKIDRKCENGLIWKVEVGFEPNLVYWYNVWTLICSCSQRSCSMVKGHLKSSCSRCGDLDQMLTYIIHKPRQQATGPGTSKYFLKWAPFWNLISEMKTVTFFRRKLSQLQKKRNNSASDNYISIKQGQTRTSSGPIWVPF